MPHTSKHKPQIRHTYMSKVIEPAKVKRVVREMKKRLKLYDFDAFAFTGMSGCLIGPVIAHAMGKSVIAVRKADDQSTHSSNLVEGDEAALKYVIVDDFINTGRTATRIVEAVKNFNPAAYCIGVAFASDAYRDPAIVHPEAHLVDTDWNTIAKLPNLMCEA